VVARPAERDGYAPCAALRERLLIDPSHPRKKTVRRRSPGARWRSSAMLSPLTARVVRVRTPRFCLPAPARATVPLKGEAAAPSRSRARIDGLLYERLIAGADVVSARVVAESERAPDFQVATAAAGVSSVVPVRREARQSRRRRTRGVRRSVSLRPVSFAHGRHQRRDRHRSHAIAGYICSFPRPDIAIGICAANGAVSRRFVDGAEVVSTCELRMGATRCVRLAHPALSLQDFHVADRVRSRMADGRRRGRLVIITRGGKGIFFRSVGDVAADALRLRAPAGRVSRPCAG